MPARLLPLRIYRGRKPATVGALSPLLIFDSGKPTTVNLGRLFRRSFEVLFLIFPARLNGHRGRKIITGKTT
jgi:hypothetical protein